MIISKDKKTAIVKELRAGKLTYAELVTKHHISMSTIIHLAKQHGIKRKRGRKFTEVTVVPDKIKAAILKKLRTDQLTYKELAAEHHISTATVIWLAKQHGIRRKRGRKRLDERRQAILDALPGRTYAEVGNMFHITKQAVGHVAATHGIRRYRPSSVGVPKPQKRDRN